jgi:hypothetical protein
MVNRTVKILGWGNDSTRTTIIASLDGQEVFSGPVILEKFSEANQTEQTAPTLFTFEIPLEFVGVKKMSVRVADSTVRFGQIVANYATVHMGGITYSSGHDSFVDIADDDGTGIKDPRSNVVINGRPQKADRTWGNGTWHWTVDPGSVLEYDLTITEPGMNDD